MDILGVWELLEFDSLSLLRHSLRIQDENQIAVLPRDPQRNDRVQHTLSSNEILLAHCYRNRIRVGN